MNFPDVLTPGLPARSSGRKVWFLLREKVVLAWPEKVFRSAGQTAGAFLHEDLRPSVDQAHDDRRRSSSKVLILIIGEAVLDRLDDVQVANFMKECPDSAAMMPVMIGPRAESGAD